MHVLYVRSAAFRHLFHPVTCAVVPGRSHKRNNTRLWGGKRMIQWQRNGWNTMFSGCVSECASAIACVITAESAWLSSETHSRCQSWRALPQRPGWLDLTSPSLFWDVHKPPRYFIQHENSYSIITSWCKHTHQKQHVRHPVTPLYDSTTETRIITFFNTGWYILSINWPARGHSTVPAQSAGN